MGQLQPIRSRYPAPTFTHVEAYLLAHPLPGAWSNGTATEYGQALTTLATRLTAVGIRAASDVAVLDEPPGAAALQEVFTAAFGHTGAATWVRPFSTLRSALTWWRESAGWINGYPTASWAKPKVVVDTTRTLTRGQITALWRLLYETAARAEDILTLDVDDIDQPNKCARVISEGGATDRVFLQIGAAMFLPRLLAGRTAGPVFLADRRPTRAVATADLCPVTGRARRSGRRAAEIFEQTTRPLADSLEQQQGWILHPLRHATLIHGAENGASTPTLLARSRHASVRSLERYARTGPDAIAAHVAATDPAARRRRTGAGR